MKTQAPLPPSFIASSLSAIALRLTARNGPDRFDLAELAWSLNCLAAQIEERDPPHRPVCPQCGGRATFSGRTCEGCGDIAAEHDRARQRTGTAQAESAREAELTKALREEMKRQERRGRDGWKRAKNVIDITNCVAGYAGKGGKK